MTFEKKTSMASALTVAAAVIGALLVSGPSFAHENASDLRHKAEPGAVLEQTVEDLPLQNGGTQRLMLYGPFKDGRGVIVMFPGGAGDVGIERNGTIRNDENFVVRTRQMWAKRGYGVVIVDAINHESMRGIRSTPQYAKVEETILAYVRSVTSEPIWVMGTSQGSIAAMLAAATAYPHELTGVVLTESVSVLGKSRETVFDARPQDVRVPALIVANRDDECWVAPPDKAREIAAAMSHSHAVVLMIDGGQYGARNKCGSLSPHGYWGIEKTVVDEIDKWMLGIDADRRG